MNKLPYVNDLACSHPNLIWCKIPNSEGKDYKYVYEEGVRRRAKSDLPATLLDEPCSNVRTDDRGNTYVCSSRVSRVACKRVLLPVRCGKCWNCQKARRIEWQNKLKLAYHGYSKNFGDDFALGFLTLTFNEKTINSPLFKDCLYPNNGEGEITYKPVYNAFIQSFLKRLRAKRGENLSFRYFIVSEFGEHNNRFHFHCLLYLFEVGRLKQEAQEYYKTHSNHSCYVKRGRRKDGHRVRSKQSPLEVYLRDKILRQWTDGSWRNLDSRIYIEKATDEHARSIHAHGEYGYIDFCIASNCGACDYVTKYTLKTINENTYHRESKGMCNSFVQKYIDGIWYDGPMVNDIFDGTLTRLKWTDRSGHSYDIAMPKYFYRKYGSPEVRNKVFWENYNRIVSEYENRYGSISENYINLQKKRRQELNEVSLLVGHELLFAAYKSYETSPFRFALYVDNQIPDAEG